MSAPDAGHGHGGGGFDVKKAFAIAALIFLVLTLNVIGMLTGQIGGLFQMLKLNGGVVLAILAAVFFLKK